MSARLVEDAGIYSFGKVSGAGPVVRQYRGLLRFEIDFKEDMTKAWLTNSLATDDGRTVGARNRQSLHEKLDEYIDWFLKETGK